MLSSSQFFIIIVIFIWIKSSRASNSPNEIKSSDDNTVVLHLLPLTIASISPKTMDFTVDFNVLTSWTKANFNESLLTSQNIQGISKVNKRDFEETYPPEFRFGNCKECNDILVDNTLVYYNRKILRFFVTPRFTLKFICKFNMLNYPFDTQICNITICFISDSRKIEYGLLDYSLNNINTPPDYYLLNISTSVFKQNHGDDRISLECVTYEFHLKHMILRDISVVYLPSFLIVVISWMTFWLEVSAAGPRVSLGLTSSLTLITHFNSAQSSLPSVSILMALDVWMLVCIMTVFASIVEYAIVYNKCRKLKETVKSRSEIKSIPSSKGKCLTLWKNIFSEISSNPTSLDEISRIVFPLFFTLFVFFYCIYYLILS